MAHPCTALLFFVLFAFSCATFTLASPLPLPNPDAKAVGLAKRITHVGRGTWFHVGLGNCGKWDVDSSPIIAISKARYDSNGGSNCGQWIQITNTANGKVAFGKTRDSCQSCGWEDLDMSPSLFQKLDPLSVGVLKISWHFMNRQWAP